MEPIHFVIVTGMSGAGKSTALKMLEDAGYFCVDNLPAPLIPKFAELGMAGSGEYDRVVLVTDIRGGQTFEGLFEALEALQAGQTLDAINVCIDSAIDSLLELTGERASDAVIDQVFARFCVGK